MVDVDMADTNGLVHLCEEFHALTDAHEVVVESVPAVVAAIVSRHPLNTPSQSHLMWMSRETMKLLTRHAEVLQREIRVSRREAAISARG